MDSMDRKTEELRLERTLSQVKAQLDEGEENYRRIQGDLRHYLDDFWETKTADFRDEAQRTEEVERQRRILAVASQRRRQYTRMLSTPYFGRIDLKEAELSTSELIYIGLGTLTEEASHELLVYDWRSPVASIFYDFELGKVWYDSPVGRIEGVVSFKRQYRIANGRLEMMFDADVTINDELLQEILGKSVNDKMRTIVTSIQREQNQVIRDESHRWLFVEGPAGSGKTSVALHRAAYWLYHQRNALTPRNILILSPNPVFSDYISNVLPELGEENVRRITFSDYIEHLKPEIPAEFQSWTQQLEELLAPAEEAKRQVHLLAVHYKSSSAFLSVLESYLLELEKGWVVEHPDLVFRGESIWSRADWKKFFLNDLTYLPIAGRLAKIRRLIQLRMRPLVKKIRVEKAQEITEKAEEVNEKTIIMLARLAARDELRPVVELMEQLTEINVLAQYRRLFENPNLLYQQIPEPTRMEWGSICQRTLTCFDQGKIPFEDVSALLYLYGLIHGFTEKKEIRHLIVDEGQDYTSLQYALLKRLFPRTAWTVLGDRAQAVHPSTSGASFEEAGRILGAVDPGFIKLTKSYRSTRAIQTFCSALLPETILVDAVERLGPLPYLIKAASYEQMVQAVPKLIEGWRTEGLRSIAVICKTARQSKEVFWALTSLVTIDLVDEETAQFKRDVVVIPSYLAKGLEFDAVLVWGADDLTYGREEERKLFYVNCTRALHRLAVCYHDRITPFVADVDGSLYQEEII